MTKLNEILEMCLDRGVVYVEFDPRFPGVEVPRDQRTGDSLILRFSHYYNTPIDLTEDYIAQELTFGGRPYPCHVPLAAIRAAKVEEHDLQAAPVPKKPALRLVGGDDD
jgi:stringent starvation protein B